jgi:drug/metabolite transporter (DMT)-like permease
MQFLVQSIPFIFIVIWSSGFIVAKVVALYSEPLSFLCLRFLGVMILMTVLAWWARAPWPTQPRTLLHLTVAGVLIHAGYLSGVWTAVNLGMPAGVVALIVNLQPVITAAWVYWSGEKVSGRQWFGLLLGFFGVLLVIAEKISSIGLSVESVSLAIFALACITAGTLYQKKYCANLDFRTSQVVQFTACLVAVLPFAALFENFHFNWTPALIGAYLWSVFGLTGTGTSLLYFMIRHHSATQVTSYLYLVPAVTALMAWGMFGETLLWLAVLGMGVAMLGVALVTRKS